MNFVKGSHENLIVPHEDNFDELNLLSRDKEVKVDVAKEDKSSGALGTGEISLQHGLMVHGSGQYKPRPPNWCRDALFEPACEKTKQCAL